VQATGLIADRQDGRSAKAGRRRPEWARAFTMAGLALPSIVLMTVVNAYPVAYAAIQAVHDGDLLNLGNFVGLANFADALTDRLFWWSAAFTAIFSLCGIFGSWAVGFALALLLKPDFPGKNLFKILLLLPWIVPIVVSSMSWNWLTATPDSLLPVLAEDLGFGRVMFLADPTMAMITVCLFKVWISYPFMMMMMAAALEGIEPNIYEAARVDGAGRRQQLRHIVLPMTARSTYIAWILMAMFSVNDFATIFLLTGGGPVNSTTSLIVLAYRSVFQDFRPGYGVAISFLMTAALVTMSVVLLRQIRKANLQ